MFRLKSYTKNSLTFSLAFAVLWSLVACVSLCSVEDTLHAAEQTASTTLATDRTDIEPIDDCCGCPDISSPSGTIQQRETGDQIRVLNADAAPSITGIAPDPIFADRTSNFPDTLPPKINAPPVFLRHRTIRI